MYSQHSSENPIRTKISKFPRLFSQVNFPTAKIPGHSLLVNFAKPIKTVFVILITVILFVGFILGAYAIEGSYNVGFTPDFQNQQTLYSSGNSFFGKYTDLITVKVTVHGTQEFSIYTDEVTVGELIDSLAIKLDANDTVNHEKTDTVFDGMQIRIDRVETKTHTETVTVPFTTKTIESQTIPKGTKKVLQAGSNGSTTQTVTETYVNGELQNRDVVVETVNVTPVEEVVELGVGGVYTDINGNSYAYSYYIDVTATAYGTLSGITASGKAIELGMIAVDPRVIPLGTKVYLTGSWGDMGVHSAEDTGGSIKGNKIDVYLGDDYNLLRQFGRRSMRVYILD
ncbi:MAG: G5 domain-containing protein [Clostridia bacterium]|nr:G5 domain-containing protein [Clostridia bacterium]